MNCKKLLLLSIRNLLRNRRRTLITVLIISCGFTTFGLVAGYMHWAFVGLRKLTVNTSHTCSGGTGHFQIIRQEMLENPTDSIREHGIDNYRQKVIDLSKLSNVDFVMPRIEFAGLVKNGDISVPYLGLGVIPENEILLRDDLNLTLTEIDNSALHALQNSLNGVILGKTMVTMLKAKIGDYLSLMALGGGDDNMPKVKLVGVFTGDSKTADTYLLMTKISTVQRLLQTSKVARLVVVVDENKHTYKRTDRTIDRMAKQAIEMLHEKEPDIHYITQKWHEISEYHNTIKAIYISIFTFMSSVIFVIVVLSANNTMFMAIMERVREIGTLRSIGVPIKWIRIIILMEGILMGVVGSVVGLCVQQLVTFTINHIIHIPMPPPPGTDMWYRLAIAPSPPVLPWIFVLMVLSTAVSSFLTFQKIKKKSIVEALIHT